MSKKKLAVLESGPLHLFFTSSIYLLWDLKKDYDLVLIAHEDCQSDPYFNKLKLLGEVKEIYFFPPKNSIRNAYESKRIFKSALDKYQPDVLFYSSCSYSYGLFINELTSNLLPKTIKIIYQTAFEPLDWSKDALARVDHKVSKIDLKFLTRKFKRKMVMLINKIIFFINFKMIPLFIFGKFFQPLFNPYFPVEPKDDATVVRNNFLKKDFYLSFDAISYEVIKEKYKNLGSFLCENPIKRNFNEVSKFFFNSGPVENRILILPTWGASSLEDLKVWSQVITEMHKQYPDHSFQVKLHPGVKDSNTSLTFDSLLEKFSFLKLVNPNIPAQKLINESTIILCQGGGVAWFSSFLSRKKVVVLDLFGSETGSLMIPYKNKLNYVKTIDDLSALISYEHQEEERPLSQLLSEVDV